MSRLTNIHTAEQLLRGLGIVLARELNQLQVESRSGTLSQRSLSKLSLVGNQISQYAKAAKDVLPDKSLSAMSDEDLEEAVDLLKERHFKDNKDNTVGRVVLND
jgi:hypothetical protein